MGSGVGETWGRLLPGAKGITPLESDDHIWFYGLPVPAAMELRDTGTPTGHAMCNAMLCYQSVIDF